MYIRKIFKGFMLAGLISTVGHLQAENTKPYFSIPLIDLNDQANRQIIVDKEKGVYLAHPTTVLLEDGKTMLAVYPRGTHAKGECVLKRSEDGGLTWGERLGAPGRPDDWVKPGVQEVPTIHRVVDAEGKKRLIIFTGLYPVRISVSEDDGMTWTPFKPVGDWGGIVVMSTVFELNTGKGHYMALFHDDGRFFTKAGRKGKQKDMAFYKTTSRDGGMTWSFPEIIFKRSDVHLCEPGSIRSPDGKQIAVLLRENSRTKNSHIMFSDDEGKTWSTPREMPNSLNGDRHTGKYGPEGRIFISFRDRSPTGKKSPTAGDWVGWVGTYDDLLKGNEGQYRVRVKKNHPYKKGSRLRTGDCAYPGVEILPDGTFVTTTYGTWEKDKSHYILSVRFKLEELDKMAKK
ncbi:sialidase family protein [Verrucomicrobiota bacterium]